MITEKIENRKDIKDCLSYIFIIFMVGCLVGWIYEEFFYWFTEGMLRNRGILYGPWLPIYGVGALAIYSMKPLKKNPALIFFLCATITGIVEYVIGFASIHILGMRLWDYRGLFLNLHGIICLRSVISFAVMGLVFHYLIEPAGERMIKKVNPDIVHAICLVLLFVFVIDCILSALFRTPITY